MSLDLYAIGNALVDSEYLVSDEFLVRHTLEKGCMTLIDGDRQRDLIDALSREYNCAKRASGGSAANSVIAFSAFGGRAFYACKVSDDDTARFTCMTCYRPASVLRPMPALLAASLAPAW